MSRPSGMIDTLSVVTLSFAGLSAVSRAKAAAANGWLDRQRTILEVLTSIRRAGADMILTYWAAEATAWLD